MNENEVEIYPLVGEKISGRWLATVAFISVIALELIVPVAGYAQTASLLKLQDTIQLVVVKGKFDHFAVDLVGKRLFAAATGNQSVEVIDLASGKVSESLSAMGKPHGLAWVASTGRLYVADGAKGQLRVYEGKPFRLTGTIGLSEDADDMVYDSDAQKLYVGHGGGDAANPARVAVIDTASFKLIANIPVGAHPEALDIDTTGNRVFANIADKNEIAVIDVASNTVVATWKLSSAADNVPMAYDDEQKVLYVACRKPGMLLAVNTQTGKEAASARAGDGADDLFLDRAGKRVFVISGGGKVDVFDVSKYPELTLLGAVATEPGAKTGLFVPQMSTLYVGVPGTPGHAAEIRAYVTSEQMR